MTPRLGIAAFAAVVTLIGQCPSLAAEALIKPYSGPPRLTPDQIQKAKALGPRDCIILIYPEQWNKGAVLACNSPTPQEIDSVRSRWLLEHSRRSESDAELLLADDYLSGGDGIARNLDEGIRLLRSSAEHGNPIAATRLAHRYFKGDGVAKDYQQAARWYSESSRANDFIAMAYYGWMLVLGQGVAKDEKRGLELLNAADREGYPEAARLLGLLYFDPKRPFHDQNKGLDLLRRAALEGSRGAQADLDQLAKLGGPAEK